MKPLLATILILLLLSVSYSQDTEFTFGARSSAMGNANLALNDPYSSKNSIGAFGLLKSSGFYSGYSNLFGLAELQWGYAGVNIHSKYGNLGLGVSRFGDDIYNQSLVSLGLANTIGSFSLGVKINHHQIQIEGAGSQNALTFDLGGIIHFSEAFLLGMQIRNVSASGTTGEIFIPVVMEVGCSYSPSSTINLLIDLSQELESQFAIRSGLEYLATEWLSLRVGVQPLTAVPGGGFGLHFGRFEIDYALQSSRVMGLTHHYSLNFQFGT